MLIDLFQNPRKTEPKSILLFRRFVIAILLVLLITIFTILVIGVFNEEPSIRSSFITNNVIPAPGEDIFF